MYDKVDASLNFAGRELEILKFWNEERIFDKSVEIREGGPVFTFYDGPPTANGKPHIGHVITRAVKDIIPRYKTMKGCRVLRKAGWDTHGLPVELEVEKALGISGKPEIEEYGVMAFNEKCKESVWKYSREWTDMSERVGHWADMENPYVTYHTEYIESVWWSLKKIWDMGLIYKGYKVVPYCPRCGTPLSSHEVAQGYKDVCETSVFVKFKLKGACDEYFLAWTTTPWTLPSNVALAVNADVEYAKVLCQGEKYILAASLLDQVLTGRYEVLEKMPGSSLEGVEYEKLFDFYETEEKCCYIVCDGYVTLSDGTGIVHIAPAFGEDDSRVGKKYGLPFVQLVDEQGRFVPEAAPWAGLFVKDADPLITENLRETNKLYKTAEYEHSYPFCWRCETPLLYYARDSWFIRMTAVRDKLVANNNTVNWYPDNVRTGRFGNFLENVLDWSLSRERYWGTPLPVWECPEEQAGCGYSHCIGSLAELSEMSEGDVTGIDPHRPYIDEVTLKCPKCGGAMRRVPEVIDCWYDAGSMPFAQWHYPFENREVFEENFPADFISEAMDQTRGWFYTLMAISTLVFDRSPYKNVIVLGLVQDKDGQKMSKHKGNVIDPWTALNKQGADAVRWYFYTNSAPWLPNRFYEEAVSEAQRKFMSTFWNTYAFYVLYAEIDKFNPLEHKLEPELLCSLDKWILSRLHSLIRKVDECLDKYELTESSRAMTDFTDELSNWYVRRSRERFWAGGMPQDKINAYMTLYEVLTVLTRLSAPYVPFMSECIYANLVRNIDKNAPPSVHLCDFPEFDPSMVDEDLTRGMENVLKIVMLGRAARNEAAVKNRQPVSEMFVAAEGAALSEEDEQVIRQELNVKNVATVESAEEFIDYKFKPQLRTLGPKYGKLLPAIAEALKNVDGVSFMAELDAGGARLTVEGEEIVLCPDDVLVETGRREGYYSASDRGYTVVIDARLTPELIEEGFVREVISKVQTMRKEADFNVTDRIGFYYGGNERIADIISRNRETVASEVLAEELRDFGGAEIEPGRAKGFTKEWNINGEPVRFGVYVKGNS